MMKMLTSILATIVLFLSTQCMVIPGNVFKKECPAKKSCCSSKKSCSTKEKKEPAKGCKDACNPFMACCGCLYEGIAKQELNLHKPFGLSIKNGHKELQFVSTYISGLWQPPETSI